MWYTTCNSCVICCCTWIAREYISIGIYNRPIRLRDPASTTRTSTFPPLNSTQVPEQHRCAPDSIDQLGPTTNIETVIVLEARLCHYGPSRHLTPQDTALSISLWNVSLMQIRHYDHRAVHHIDCEITFPDFQHQRSIQSLLYSTR